MKQKYQIWKKIKENELLIQEYAVLETNSSKRELQNLHGENFALLCEQTYDARAVEESISEGKDSLISLLRNRHFYPIGLYMNKIADSVMTMFASKNEQREDLIFDDRDFLLTNVEAPEIETELGDEVEGESADDIDVFFKDDVEVSESHSPGSNDDDTIDEEND